MTPALRAKPLRPFPPAGDDVELENPATNQPLLQPEIIHSEERESSRAGGKKDPGSGPTTTRSFFAVTESTTTSTTTPTPRTRPRPRPTTAAPPFPSIGPQVPIDYEDSDTDYGHGYDSFEETPGISGDPTKVRTPNAKDQIHSDASGGIALVISIIAGALIIVILIILLILKFKGRRDGTYKVDETKNYEGIPTVPTPMVNGQGNGNIKPGDRRPVKKQSKDVKEWYV